MITSNFTGRDIVFINNNIIFKATNVGMKSKTELEIASLEVFKEVKEMANTHENLSSRKIKSWQSKFSDKTTTLEKTAQLEILIQNLNSGLNEIGENQSLLKVVTLISKTIYNFEKLQPFEEANGLIARMLGNYVAIYSNMPIIVFYPDDKRVYNLAISRDNSEEFTRFIAKKIKEVAYDYMGDICDLVKTNPNSGIYQHPATAKKMIVEWHELNRL